LGKDHLKPDEIEVHKDSFGESAENVDQFTEPNTQETLIDDNDTEKEDSKPLLLIVEDNYDLRSYIRSYLTSDYRISEAIDGEMGLEKSIEKIPDLVISDVMMPKMDGYELCRNLKTNELTSHIPVILLTAKAALEDRLEGLETGADDFISKPFEQDELLIRIKNLINQRQKLREIFSKKITSPESYLQKLQDSLINTMDQRFLQKANELVEKNMQDYNFSVELLSSEMNMSRMQLHRKLKAIVNQSAGEFVRTIRLNRAASLLMEEYGNVTQVAFEVGFNNLSWFTKCFQEQFGVLPSEYKRNITKTYKE
jgi:DNA-binding response OmpR family regulator